MRTCALLLANSMPLTVHLCALLLLCSLTSCLGNRYEDCLSNIIACADVEFGYPFGINGSGCGDPDFQLRSCDYQSQTLIGIPIDIGGDEYHIVQASFLSNSSINKLLTIVNDNVWGGNCSLSGNYSQFWMSGSHFQVRDGYTNLTLWKQCDQVPHNLARLPAYNLSLCGDDWYYSLTPHLNLDGAAFCNASQLPTKQNLSQTINNKTLLTQGFEVTWNVDPNREQRCVACLNSNGNCGYDISKPQMFLCHCRDGTSHPHKCPGNGTQDTRGRNMSAVKIGCSVGVVLTAIVAVIMFVSFYAKRRKSPPGDFSSRVEKFLKQYAYEMPTRYTHSQLKKITNNFAEKLGEGGFGVVYKGTLPNGVLVAVKILDRQRHSETQFMNEVATIGWVHHFNLVRLLGYCFESIISAVVYEYMVNGSLEKFIFAQKEDQVLTWEQLFSIALGAARGIAYLHQDCDKRIIHFDIKPHNILLDADFTPKVADFGLAKLCGKEDDHVSMTAGRGTPGYVAPELCVGDMGPVTDKSDVYSFGMLLLEIVGGRKNIDWKASRSSQFFFPQWAFKLLQSEEIAKRLRGGGEEVEIDKEDEQKARRLTKVGLWCIQYNQKDRPCMSRVVQMLEGNADDVPNPPHLSIPQIDQKNLYHLPRKGLVQFRSNISYQFIQRKCCTVATLTLLG